MKVLAADIGGTNTKMGLCDESGRIERYREYATESERGGPHVVERLIEHLKEYDGFDAVAISTAGQVDAEAGRIVYANENIPNYTGMNLADMLTSRFGKPVKVENDVNAAALGEGRFGAARSYRDYLCLTFGTGIGGAIVIDRRLYRGADGIAAEFGHMLTGPDRSLYEARASTKALLRAALRKTSEKVDGKQIFDKMRNGDDEWSALFLEWVEEVSVGLSSLVHIFNPAAIVLGGGIMEQEEAVRLVEWRTKQWIMSSFRGVTILQAGLGNKAGLLGAATLFFRKDDVKEAMHSEQR